MGPKGQQGYRQGRPWPPAEGALFTLGSLGQGATRGPGKGSQSSKSLQPEGPWCTWVRSRRAHTYLQAHPSPCPQRAAEPLGWGRAPGQGPGICTPSPATRPGPAVLTLCGGPGVGTLPCLFPSLGRGTYLRRLSRPCWLEFFLRSTELLMLLVDARWPATWPDPGSGDAAASKAPAPPALCCPPPATGTLYPPGCSLPFPSLPLLTPLSVSVPVPFVPSHLPSVWLSDLSLALTASPCLASVCLSVTFCLSLLASLAQGVLGYPVPSAPSLWPLTLWVSPSGCLAAASHLPPQSPLPTRLGLLHLPSLSFRD